MRVTLDRDGPLYHAVYDQRTSTERDPQSVQGVGHQAPQGAQHRFHPHPQHPDLSGHQCQSEASGTRAQRLLAHRASEDGRLSDGPAEPQACSPNPASTWPG